MEFGLFLEFSGQEGADEAKVFQQGFSLVDAAESMGVESVWLPEYHFIPFSVLSSPLAVATAVAARTKRMRIGFGVYLLPLASSAPFNSLPTQYRISVDGEQKWFGQ